MSVTLIFLIVAAVGAFLILCGAFLWALAPNLGVGQIRGQFVQPSAATQSPLSRLVGALIWAYKESWKLFKRVFTHPGEFDAGQKLIVVGFPVLILGLFGAAIAAIVNGVGGGGGGDGSSTSPTDTSPSTKTS